MKSIPLSMFFIGAVALLLIGCAATYQQDCRVYLQSEPSGAEVWKNDFYMGKTPYLLRYTATGIEDEQGYLQVPPLVIKKAGYKPYLLEMKLDLEDGDGYDWEAYIPLEKIQENDTDK